VTAEDAPGRPLPRPGPDGFSAWELAEHYRFPAGLDGSGISIAVIRLYGGFRRSDVQQYFAAAGRAAPAVDEVALGSEANNPVANPQANAELVRDIEILGTAAPGARIAVYFAGNTEMGVADGFASAIHDRERQNSVICLTWEIPEADVSPMLASTVDNLIQSAVLMGKVVCAPAGSWGVNAALAPGFPGTSPWVLSCAATRAVAGASGLIERPVADGALAPAASQRHERPQWQARTGRGLPRGISGRLVPDVSCLADDHGYRCHVNGNWTAVPGSGAAVCMWAGLIARLQQAVGLPGLRVPHLYETLGPRGVLAAVEPGSAQARWSPSTGWGSPDGERLQAALAKRGRRPR